MADLNKILYGDDAPDERFGLSTLLTEAEWIKFKAECLESIDEDDDY